MTTIDSPIAANVWKVLVAPGDDVAVGQVLTILESMKMEIPIESPVAGRVTSVDIAEGDAVAEGAQMFAVE